MQGLLGNRNRLGRAAGMLLLPAVLLALMVSVSACSSSDSAGAACEAHSDCARGMFCRMGECAEQSCVTDGDCGGEGVVCLSDLLMCSARECLPDAEAGSPDACQEGYHCEGGTCIIDAVVDPDASTDVKTPGDSGGGEDVPPVEADPCAPCAEDSECGPAKSCEQLGATKHCLPICENDAGCESGWSCFQLTNEAKVCVPVSFQCAAPCLQTGCPEGQTCDPRDPNAETPAETAGQCVDAMAGCDTCVYDWECGQGSRCILTMAGFQFCMSECASAEDCEDWATCEERDDAEGLMVCVPKTQSCCGPDCGQDCDPECTGTTPHCYMGMCVECTEDPHCEDRNATCDDENGLYMCVGGCAETPTTPYACPDGNGCCQCLENDDCGVDGVCTDNVCENDPCGGACVAPYPACAIINGTPSCVPCTEDQHCIDAGTGTTCDPTTFFCDSPAGTCTQQGCVMNGCPTDNPFGNLECDPDSGCCYDPEGNCDNVTAFCNGATGSECVSVFDIFMGGIGGVPGMPTDAAFGMCTCNAAMSTLCGLLPNTPGCDEAGICWPGGSCMPIGTLMQLLTSLGGSAGAPLMGGDFCTSALF